MADSHRLPGEWVDEARALGNDSEIRRFVRDPDRAATFLVWVLRHEDSPDPIETRLTTIHGSERPVRHDYAIGVSDSEAAGIDTAESFVDALETRLRDQRMSAAEPDVDEVQDLIADFTGPGIGYRIGRFLARLGR